MEEKYMSMKKYSVHFVQGAHVFEARDGREIHVNEEIFCSFCPRSSRF
jgi:hypothetical protein